MTNRSERRPSDPMKILFGIRPELSLLTKGGNWTAGIVFGNTSPIVSYAESGGFQRQRHPVV